MLILLLAALLSESARATPPNLQTPGPVIYLVDNLDEKNQLGWCIDTLGRGFSEQLQVHSCKPQGGDVQFYHDPASGHIASAEFEGKCATLIGSSDINVPFGLHDCKASNKDQAFVYDPESKEFHPSYDEKLCLAAGAESRTAGPFMSRDLQLQPCMSVASKLRRWIVKGED
ncbi:MAG: RICIN domain-containing protein [Alphaproteobacteria bacterium]